ncbi:MAG: branched-chain amino acid ABC transporter permease [Caldimicrobium sp.]|nr:branched-chain amino acid ABC transporter permease [Caldimicrobium sp.]MCX7612718.1 branched-chain amino acid ABC transporter permease [Caldimicrobium sp.]MDW8183343.1 branched-chain amino acid ABC transporter permease [Caldimicrobium sp.]
MELFLQFFFSGLTVGAIYALIALGFNIIYNTTSILNLAQGEFVVLGGLLMWYFLEKIHLPYGVSIILTLGISGLVGLAMERLSIRPLLKTADPLLLILITIAFSILLRGILMFLFGKEPYGYPPISEGAPLIIGGAIIQRQVLWIFLFVLFTMLFLYIFFNRTIFGIAMKACAIDSLSATLLGINTSQMVMVSFILSGIFASLAGVLVTPITFVEYDKGPLLTIKGFTAAILGGLGSNWGVMAGGFLLGILESLIAGYIHSGLKDALALLLLLSMLLFKPAGLFQSSEQARLRKL